MGSSGSVRSEGATPSHTQRPPEYVLPKAAISSTLLTNCLLIRIIALVGGFLLLIAQVRPPKGPLGAIERKNELVAITIPA